MKLHAAPAVVVAVGLVAATLVRYGLGGEGVAWSAVQIALVALAWVDLRERRLPNVIVVPLGVGAIVLRAAFERGALVEILVAGAVAFGAFLVLAAAARGGLGMGDVKLAAAEGLLFGKAAVEALLLGVVLGGLAAALLLVTRRAGRRTTYAYGPYLVLGAAIAILAFRPPPLV
ncbi:MAG TPA: A24 family peptidase [Gaiellaceae bacterium]|nr:A24 family peptidase [Gaiellaceae bacterium]